MNIADRLSEHATSTPERAAVIAGDRILQFRALDLAAWRAAASLRAGGVKPGDVVALSIGDGTLKLVAGYALARMGAVQLHLASTDGLPVCERLAARHRPDAVLTDREVPGLAGIRRLGAERSWLEETGPPQDPSLRAPGGDAPWLIMRTSGTTAAPKTLLQSHATFVARRQLAEGPCGFASSDRYLAVLSLDITLGFKMCLDAHWPGAAVILATQALSYDKIIEIAKRHRANFTYLTPAHLGSMLRLPAGISQLPGLRVLRCGSMAMPENLRKRVIERVSPNLVISYGTADLDCGLTEADAQTLASHPGSVGKPRAGIELQIADADGKALPSGEVGEVRARVPDMPAGYCDDPAASARAFREGWFYPGDLGVLGAAGELYLKGRSDEMMNCDGMKIYPADIEAVLLEHPAVSEAVAFALDSARRQHIPVAAVTLREPVQDGALFAWCRERLGAAAPHRIVRLESLPRNASGKVLTRKIADAMRGQRN